MGANTSMIEYSDTHSSSITSTRAEAAEPPSEETEALHLETRMRRLLLVMAQMRLAMVQRPAR